MLRIMAWLMLSLFLKDVGQILRGAVEIHVGRGLRRGKVVLEGHSYD